MSPPVSRIEGAALEVPLASWTIPALLQRAAALAPGEAIVMPGERVTHSEFAGRAGAFAAELQQLGIARGDRVGLLQHDSAAALARLFGTICAGAVPVPVNTRYKRRELEHLAFDAGLSLLVTSAEHSVLAQEVARPPGCELLIVDRLAGPGRAARDPGAPLSPLSPAPAPAPVPALALAPADDGVMLYTSGTTANPKGCVYTHAGMVAQGFAYARALELVPEDRYFTPLPFFHVSAIVSMLAVLAAGCTLCHVGARFDPEPALELLVREHCSIAFPAFETIWLQVLALPGFETADLSRLRLTVNVGSPGSLRRMQAALPAVPQVSAFGGTEYGGFATLGRAGESLEARVETSGRPLAGVELRAIDCETGADVPVGAVGEALMRGPTRFARYHGDGDATARAIDADGWYHSGDLIRIDADGRIAFVGRSKDMLKVGGENVAAVEVETFLLTHPAVAIAQIVAAPDGRYVEVPAAFVQLRSGAVCSEQELIDHCIGRIASFKVPRYVRFVEEWPMSGTKIQKFQLRERIARELEQAGISEAPRIVSGTRAPR